MAPLKFRAWDKQKNVMLEKPIVDEERGSLDYTFTQLAINFDGLVLGFSSHDWGKDGIHEHDVNVKDRFILMQSTGLLDKNGKEIFEGDILKGTSYLYGFQLETGEQFDYFGVVEWGSQADCGLCWHLVESDGGIYNLSQTVHRNTIDYSTGEIVGNMWENPELLSPAKDDR